MVKKSQNKFEKTLKHSKWSQNLQTDCKVGLQLMIITIIN